MNAWYGPIGSIKRLTCVNCGRLYSDIQQSEVESENKALRNLNRFLKEGNKNLMEANMKLRREIETDDILLEDRNRVVNQFDCPSHGKSCVPYALQEIKRLKDQVHNLKVDLTLKGMESISRHIGSSK